MRFLLLSMLVAVAGCSREEAAVSLPAPPPVDLIDWIGSSDAQQLWRAAVSADGAGAPGPMAREEVDCAVADQRQLAQEGERLISPAERPLMWEAALLRTAYLEIVDAPTAAPDTPEAKAARLADVELGHANRDHALRTYAARRHQHLHEPALLLFREALAQVAVERALAARREAVRQRLEAAPDADLAELVPSGVRLSPCLPPATTPVWRITWRQAAAAQAEAVWLDRATNLLLRLDREQRT